MRFLFIEGEIFVNLALVEKVEMRHSSRTAILWSSGVHLCESGVAYNFFLKHSSDQNLVVTIS